MNSNNAHNNLYKTENLVMCQNMETTQYNAGTSTMQKSSVVRQTKFSNVCGSRAEKNMNNVVNFFGIL